MPCLFLSIHFGDVSGEKKKERERDKCILKSVIFKVIFGWPAWNAKQSSLHLPTLHSQPDFRSDSSLVARPARPCVAFPVSSASPCFFHLIFYGHAGLFLLLPLTFYWRITQRKMQAIIQLKEFKPTESSHMTSTQSVKQKIKLWKPPSCPFPVTAFPGVTDLLAFNTMS